MRKDEILREIQKLGLLAVIRGPSSGLTLKSVAALVEGGVNGIEITFSTPNAIQVVRSLNQEYGDAIILGMGTLTEPEQVQGAVDAGARFLVSPHIDESLAAAMTDTGLPVMIGALTPTEIVRAVKLGSDVVKIFPGSLVGPGYLKAIKGPFPNLRLMPTGGVSLENVGDWLAAGAFAVGAGGSLCPKQLVMDEEFGLISENARKFTAAIKDARKIS